jgi:hypothetical protein
LKYPYPDDADRTVVKPRHVNKDIFVKTKLYTTHRTGKGAPFIWAPHHDAKLTLSAYGMLVFVVHSVNIFGKFIPEDARLDWWSCWVSHARLVESLLKFHYTYDDLLAIERLSRQCHDLFYRVPEYENCWVPKIHWATHCALDILRWGPPRLMWCMLFEMKNGHIKRAVSPWSNQLPQSRTCNHPHTHAKLCIAGEAEQLLESGKIGCCFLDRST